MTQDKIREAFEEWLSAPNDSWKDDPLSVGSIQEEAWQACAAEMLPVIDYLQSSLIDALQTMEAEHSDTPDYKAGHRYLGESIRRAKEALALADKWKKGNIE
jgi:hypothetical protein